MYQLLTDSTVDLPYQLLKDKHVDFVSMNVTIDDQEYADDLGHHFDLTDFIIGLVTCDAFYRSD